MRSEHAAADGADEASDGDRVVELLGVEVVVEEDFVAFPWRAGVRRAPVAFAAVYVLVFLLAAVGGFGGRSPPVDQLATVGIVAFNAHNIPAATALVPSAVAPVAEAVIGVPVVGRLLRGLFVVGQDHAAPAAHLVDVAAGKTGVVGHVNLIEQQAATDVPAVLYYLAPVAVLVGAGYAFAATHWEDAATDSPLEVTRFGVALGLGYVATLLVGTVVFTIQSASPLSPQVFTVLPDRYLTVVFGFVYPAVLGSVGAGIVYLRREVGDGGAD